MRPSGRGTEVHVDISRNDGRTEVRFEHVGLVPECECFVICSNAWGSYLNDILRSLIETGTERPKENEEGKARADEQRQRLSIVG